jgi:hypothetical protein
MARRFFFFPRWIYETLPFLYVAFGIIAFLKLDERLGQVCSLLLVSAGVTIWVIRTRYRLKYPSYH